jgi:hypothetical protein
MFAGKRASSVMGGKLKFIPGAWTLAIPADMRIFEKRDNVI